MLETVGRFDEPIFAAEDAGLPRAGGKLLTASAFLGIMGGIETTLDTTQLAANTDGWTSTVSTPNSKSACE